MASFLMQQQQLNSNSNSNGNSNSNVGGNNSNMWSNNNNYSYNNSGFVAVPPHQLRQAQFRMPTVDELSEEQLKAVANNALTSAICSYVPSVSDTSFVPALTKALEGSVVVTAAIYLRRLVAALTAVNIQAITQDAAQRLTLAVLVVGAKFVMDSPPSNAQWAKYNGVYDLATVTAMETEVLNHLNWRLAVSAVEYSTTVENLIGQWAPVDWATVSYNVHTSATTSPAPVVSPVSPLPSPPSPGSNSSNSSSNNSSSSSSSGGGASTYNSSTSYNSYNNNNNNGEMATPARISRRPPPLVLPNSIASGGVVGGGGGGNGSVADSNNVAGEYDSPIISYTPDAIAAVLATPTSADRSAWGAARSSSSGASGVSGVSGAYITPGYNYYGSGSTTVTTTTTSASTTGVTTAPGFYYNPYSGSFGNGNGTSAVTATTTTTSGGGRGGGDVGQPQGVYADLYCSEDVSMSP